MEYLVVKAIILNILKEMKECKIVIEDLMRVSEERESLEELSSKLDKMINIASESVRILEEKDALKDFTDKMAILDNVSFDVNIIPMYNCVRSSIDNIIDNYLIGNS